MTYDFYDVVDGELQRALPSGWEKVPAKKLLGRKPFKIRHAFYSAPICGRSKLIHLLLLPASIELDGRLENQLIELRDSILSAGSTLVVISEEWNSNGPLPALEDKDVFISENLLIASPDFLWLSCRRDERYKTRVDSMDFEELSAVIHDLWKGILRYTGPTTGLQPVNMELMKDECPACHKPMVTVTGLVFPNVQLDRWDNEDWAYYNRLLPLSELKDDHARSIKEFVNLHRLTDKMITPVGSQYCRDREERILVASCPHCKAKRDDFSVEDDRLKYLHSLKSRRTCQLKYYSLSLLIDQELLASLQDGYEDCGHACMAGWGRQKEEGRGIE